MFYPTGPRKAKSSLVHWISLSCRRLMLPFFAEPWVRELRFLLRGPGCWKQEPSIPKALVAGGCVHCLPPHPVLLSVVLPVLKPSSRSPSPSRPQSPYWSRRGYLTCSYSMLGLPLGSADLTDPQLKLECPLEALGGTAGTVRVALPPPPLLGWR